MRIAIHLLALGLLLSVALWARYTQQSAQLEKALCQTTQTQIMALGAVPDTASIADLEAANKAQQATLEEALTLYAYQPSAEAVEVFCRGSINDSSLILTPASESTGWHLATEGSAKDIQRLLSALQDYPGPLVVERVQLAPCHTSETMPKGYALVQAYTTYRLELDLVTRPLATHTPLAHASP